MTTERVGGPGGIGDIRGSLFAVAAIQILLGAFCILSPLLAGEFVVTLSGVSLLLSGVTEIAHAWKTGAAGFNRPATVEGVLSILVGGVLILWPYLGLTFLALLIAIYFFVDGVQRIGQGVWMRPLPGWQWMFITGTLAILLGVAILIDLPFSAESAVGILMGVLIASRGGGILLTVYSASKP